MIKSFLSLVEIQTKVASVFPFLIGTVAALYLFGHVDLLNALLMFFSLLCIDMATTGFNHYYDYKRAILKTGYHYQVHNPLATGSFQHKTAFKILVTLVVIGTVLGLLLVLRTDWVVLVLGGLAFLVGLGYSTGPLPLSRTILGELFSGAFMGGLIPFIAFYIHLSKSELFNMAYASGQLSLNIDLTLLAPIILLAFPLACFISNVMLANNICDMDEDIINKRYTLPISIGKSNALMLYRGLIVAAFFSVAVSLVTGILPLPYALTCVTIPVISQKTKIFTHDPIKGKTFVNAVQTLMMFSATSLIGMLIAYFMA